MDIKTAIELLTLQIEAHQAELKNLVDIEDIEAFKFDIAVKKLAIKALQEMQERERESGWICVGG